MDPNEDRWIDAEEFIRYLEEEEYNRYIEDCEDDTYFDDDYQPFDDDHIDMDW